MHNISIRVTLVLSLLLALAMTLPPADISAQAKPDRPVNKLSSFAPATEGAILPNQLIVKFKRDVGPRAQSNVRRQEGIRSTTPLGLIDAEVATVEGRSAKEAARDLDNRPDVEYAVPDRLVYPTGYADEPRYEEMWGLHNAGQAVNGGPAGTPDVDVNASEASSVTQGSEDIVVAVMDDGVDFSHPDLKGREWVNTGESGAGKETNGLDDDANGYVDDVNGYDFANGDNTVHDTGEDDHGTLVAGTIAASADGQGVVGVAPNIKIMALKFLGNDPYGTPLSVAIEAISYAKNEGARISNNSWGYEGPPDPALKEAIERSGMLFVAAAGNGGEDRVGDDNDANQEQTFYPASYDSQNVLSVTAVDNRGNLAEFANYGSGSVDISAPGVDVLSTVPDLPEQPGVVLTSVGLDGGRSLVSGFGAEEIDGEAAQAAFMAKALGAVGRNGEPVVLVDDDRSTVDVPFPHDVGPTLSAAIEATTGTAPEVVEIPSAEGPDLTRLEGNVVVWATGAAYGSTDPDDLGNFERNLTRADRANLTEFLGRGGKLVLMGSNLLWGIEESAFVLDTLKLDVRGNYPTTTFRGAPDNAFAGESYDLTSPLAPPFSDHDALVPTDAAAVPQGFIGVKKWGYLSGTSIAVPHATGAAALVTSARPELLARPAAVKEILKASAKPLPAAKGTTATGGMIDADAALTTDPPPPPPPPADTVAPIVTRILPAAGAKKVAPGANITATFSEAMDKRTLNGSTVKLFRRGTTSSTAAVVRYDAVKKTVVLDPARGLRRGATYVAIVTTGVKDAVGNRLVRNKTWSFTVRR